MRIAPISEQESRALLTRVSVGKLGCSLNDEPYVVPVAFAYEPECIYVFSTFGKKIKWMRQNPKVCLQVEEIGNRSNWLSVLVTGKYLELREPQHTAEREHALEKLSEYSAWWQTPLAQRREQMSDQSIETIFFCIEIETITGLGARVEVS